MKNLELENQLIFCEKYGISPNELLLLEIILIAQEGDDDAIVNDYFNSRKHARGSTFENLKGLQEASIIHKDWKVQLPDSKKVLFSSLKTATPLALKLEEIPLNRNIVKDFYRDSFSMGKELFEVYPLSTVVKGIEFKLRRVSKKFNSLEDAFRAYGKAIRWKPEKHAEIINLVKQGIEKNYNFTTLDDFIVDHDWVNMEALTTNGILTDTNMTML